MDMGGATAAPAAGSKQANPTPATPRTGSPGVCPTAGSPATRPSSSTAKRSPSSENCPNPEGSATDESEAHAAGRASRFREETRSERMNIADEAQDRYGRKVSWGVEVGGERILFTHIAVPVMTRLKQPERQVLDTLVDAGVARSRSDALAWSVKLVGEHTEEWLAKLRDAMSAVDDVRAEGPEL